MRLKNDVFEQQTAFSDEKKRVLRDSWSAESLTEKSNFDPKSQSLTKKSNVDQNDQKCDRVILRSQ